MEFAQLSTKTNSFNKKIQLFNEITDVIALRKLIYKTIEISYSAYYEEQVVQYFKDFQHNEDIKRRARKGITYLYTVENRIIGTGSLIENRIEAVFTDPAIHFQGIGRKIMNVLLHQTEIQGYENVTLEATPGSFNSRR